MANIERNCECALCKNNIDFSFDEHLREEIENSNAVIFAGAGISTESKSVYPHSFYSQIAKELNVAEDLSFPALMQKFEDQPNGRQKLISKIVERFQHIDSWDDMKKMATRFHKELSTMPYFDKIITTNWDRYFEDYSGATPFVYDSDIAFWELAERAVLKIHGSIDNYASLVATSDDYAHSEERLREGAMGAVLKQTLATKTCIFIGYSLSDSNFLQIYNVIKEGLGPFKRTHYYVSPYIPADDIIRLKELNIEVIQTDGTYFLQTVKEHMCSRFCYALDDSYDEVFYALDEILDEHQKFVDSYKPNEEPHLICATFYQDGIIHAFKRILDLRKTGKYSDLHVLQGILHRYEDKIRAHTKSKEYTEESYFRGYSNGLLFFLLCNSHTGDEEFLADENEEIPVPPFYYHPKVGEIDDEEGYNQAVRNKPNVHKAALKQCKSVVQEMGTSEGIVIQHMPWG